MTRNLKIKELPLDERPYEKLEKYGPEMLSNAELLAIIIRSGNRNETSGFIGAKNTYARWWGKRSGLFAWCFVGAVEDYKGIGKVKAIQIKALMEFSKRVASTFSSNSKVTIRSSMDVSRLLMEEMRHLKKEVFKAILLNTKNQVIKQIDVSVGSLNASIVHPREVFAEAVKSGCSTVIFAHNHPSGDPEPQYGGYWDYKETCTCRWYTWNKGVGPCNNW